MLYRERETSNPQSKMLKHDRVHTEVQKLITLKKGKQKRGTEGSPVYYLSNKLFLMANYKAISN